MLAGGTDSRLSYWRAAATIQVPMARGRSTKSSRRSIGFGPVVVNKEVSLWQLPGLQDHPRAPDIGLL